MQKGEKVSITSFYKMKEKDVVFISMVDLYIKLTVFEMIGEESSETYKTMSYQKAKIIKSSIIWNSEHDVVTGYSVMTIADIKKIWTDKKDLFNLDIYDINLSDEVLFFLTKSEKRKMKRKIMKECYGQIDEIKKRKSIAHNIK